MRITIESVEILTSQTKGEYARGEAAIHMEDGTTKQMVFMAIGPQFESVRDLMVDGATIKVNAYVNGSILRILSPFFEEEGVMTDGG